MIYLDLDKDLLTQETLQQISRTANLTFLSPGSKTRLLLDIINDKMNLQARQFDTNTGRSFIRNANGELLDFIGDIFGVPRELSSRSEVAAEERNFVFFTEEANFGSINQGQDIVIPAGTAKIYNTQSNEVERIIYVNSEDVVLPANENRVFFAAEAEGNGSDYNAGSNTLNFLDFNAYADSMNRSLLVTNSAPVTYGENEESDENYRFRIQQQTLAGEAANGAAIRLAILSTPGVSDTIRIRYPRGVATADWLVKAVTPDVPQRLIDTVQAAVDDVQGSGMDNQAKAPVTIGAQFIFNLTYREVLDENVKNRIKTEVRKNITNKINNLDIGADLIGDQVVRVILNSDPRIESVGIPGEASNFRRINVFKRSAFSNSVVKRSIIDTYRTKANERVIMEPSLEAPIIISDNN